MKIAVITDVHANLPALRAALQAIQQEGYDLLVHTELVFYGHTHFVSDMHGQTRYINPGSIGCQVEAVAPYVMAEFSHGRHTIKYHAVAYEDAPLAKAFAARQVPEREFLRQAFFGGRF